jgi:hypothetical protein
MTENLSFERDLRSMLAARDPGPPPAGLATAVRARIAMDPRPRRFTAIGRLAGAAAVMAAAAAVLILTIVVSRPIAIGPGASTLLPPNTPFDPTADGVGIVARPNDSEVIVAVLVASLVGSGAALRVRQRAVRVVVIGLATVVALGAIAVARYEAVGWTDGSWQYGIGYRVDRQASDDAGSTDTATFVVPPNGVLTFGADIHNLAPIPITILGLASNEQQMAWGEVTAVGLLRDSHVIDITMPENTKPFAPIEVQPGQPVFLIVSGRASACALGHENGTDLPQGGASFQTINVVYEIAGMRQLTTVELPFNVDIPMDVACMSR